MRTSLNHTPFDISSKSFVSARSDKTNIVLHGSLSRTKYSYTSEQNSENYLMKTWGLLGDKVAGHYVVGRSGEIFSCFDEDYWSNHLGPDKRVSSLNKSSISIYLCNELYLEKENSRYYAFGYVHPSNLYKGPVFEHKFKGYNYWADYSKEQVASLVLLLKDICSRWDLSTTMLENTTRLIPKASARATIVSGSNASSSSYSLPFPSWALNHLSQSGVSMLSCIEEGKK
jgi:N-acetyl-anhydromuramyl-L-alanine amidase AmpD